MGECALLAGFLKVPQLYSPTTNINAAKGKTKSVPGTNGKIMNTSTTIQPTRRAQRKIKIVSQKAEGHEQVASYFVDYVNSTVD